MLVLSRKVCEQIVLGDDIRITILEVWGGRVRLGLQAPPDVSIWRKELVPAVTAATSVRNAPAFPKG